MGDAPEAERLASILDARRGDKDAEIFLTVADGRVSISGDAVEDPAEVALPDALSREAILYDLAPRIVAALDEDYVIPLGRGYPALRRAACEDLIHKNARQNAVIGLLPIPGADMPAITANQGRMILGIAAAYGEELTLERARELLGVLAAGFGLRALSRQVVKLVPVGGWAASAAIGYAGTLAMGRSTMLYFERGGQKVGEKEMEEIRRRATEEAKGFVSRLRRR